MTRRPLCTASVAATGRYRSYSAYKDSGLKWLGEIPLHWETKRLKVETRIIAGQSPPSEMVFVYSDRFPFLQGNAEFGAAFPIPRFACSEAPKSALHGDVLLSVRAPVGALNIADQVYGIGRGLSVVRAGTNFVSLFLYYLLVGIRGRLIQEATGSTYDAVTVGDVGNLKITLPPCREQRAIAAVFQAIDEKTDALERDVELMDELFHAMLDELMTGQRSAMPLIKSGVIQ